MISVIRNGVAAASFAKRIWFIAENSPDFLTVHLLSGRERLPQLRWVLAHELAHLRRRDAVGCLLFGLAGVVYYFVPWFWRLRRQVRLCREDVADAAAVTVAGAPEDYAEFLLDWGTTPAVPPGATGVAAHSSD